MLLLLTLFRDIRQNKQRWQNTENNDDITVLQFRPSNNARLLSGGIDGLVSIFDTTITSEEDSLLQVVNHGPIHKAGFLNEKVIYALSSDEHLSLYPVSSDGDDEDPEPVIFGDLRERLGCEYAIDVSPRGLEGYLGVGSHSS
jgi:WD repeat-containing protein 89